MKCLACGWNADHVSAVSYCPNCGDDLSLIDLDGNSLSTEVEACVTCGTEMLYWQLDRHPCDPQT